MTDKEIGIIWMISSGLWAAINVSLTRFLTDDFSIFQIILFGCSFASLCIIPQILKNGLLSLGIKKIKLYFVRSVFEFLGSVMAVYSITLITLPEFTSISFVTPLLTVFGASVFFKEKNSWHIWLALIAGITGVVIVAKPTMEVLHHGSLFALLAAFFWAASMLIAKKLTDGDKPSIITFYLLLIVGLLSAMPAAINWITPDLKQLVLFALMGTTGYMVHYSTAKAFSKTDVSIVMPFRFLSLVFVSIIAYFAFGQILDIPTIIGSVIILVSVMHVLRYKPTNKNKAI